MNERISIKVNNLSKKLGENQALDNISLCFESEKMHGVIGPEGAGKTTLMRCLLRLLSPNTGTVEFLQAEKDQASKILSAQEIRLKVAYMPQQSSLYPDLSIAEHLEFFKTLYQMESKAYESKKVRLLEITQLTPFLDRPAGQLSGGMSKKLGLMCALLRSPEILLLDEPTNGVDP
ncbi:MAG TPA: ABC transporter ATP-binding protein, partial [Gammaproteobacteria bacterium]|nr:ABC transporter ATP-binding protein [Gammaproteobacteria bacterium]